MNTQHQQQLPGEEQAPPYNLPVLADITRLVLVCGLYPGMINDALTNAHARLFAASFLGGANDPEKAFAEFCQRILMTRYWLNNHLSYELPFNIRAWLNPKNPNGYAGTAKWYERLTLARRKNPLHLHELKAFPEAILDIAEDPSPDNINYWSGWFIEKQAADAYLLMQAVAARLAFREMPVYRRDCWDPQ